MIMDEKDEHVKGGMLIDWDLSKLVLGESTSACQDTRTVSV